MQSSGAYQRESSSTALTRRVSSPCSTSSGGTGPTPALGRLFRCSQVLTSTSLSGIMVRPEVTKSAQMPLSNPAFPIVLDPPRRRFLLTPDRWLAVLLLTVLIGPIGSVEFAGHGMTLFWSDVTMIALVV